MSSLPDLKTLSRRRMLCLAGSAAALAGCGTRGSIALVDPPPPEGATVRRGVVATARTPVAAPAFFSDQRDFTTRFAQFDVSIPPEREPGTVSYPDREPDPLRDFVVLRAEGIDNGRGFVRAVEDSARSQVPRARTGVVFVHGYNNNFAEALMTHVQLGHDLQSPGVSVLFTWPSEARLLGYAADRENALFSRDALAGTLALMRRTSLQRYNLVAHSMGCFLALETLRSLALAGDRATLGKIGAVILISADIEIDVFRLQAPPVLAAGLPIYLLVSDDDRALRASAILRGESARVGSVRSNAELGGIDVGVVDLSAVSVSDSLRHLKVGESPEVIALVQQLRESGVAIFNDGQKVGLLDRGAAIVQGATGAILRHF